MLLTPHSGGHAMPDIGKKAPAFTLPNQDGKKIRLSDLKGKKVLLFAYPKAATSG
jgi:peroxiredoxin Q/BCP